MIEGDPHVADYEQLTPCQCNQELKRLFELCPDFGLLQLPPDQTPSKIDSDDYFTEMDAMIERRERSQTREILTQRLKQLLRFSQTTGSFNQYLFKEFSERISIWGLDRKSYSNIPSEFDYYTRLLGWDNPGNGGIFKAEKAKKIDRIAYQNFVSTSLAAKMACEESGEEPLNLAEILEEMRALDDKQEPKKTALSLLEDENLMKAWREEYIKKFNDEP